jgi:hypothetical protein
MLDGHGLTAVDEITTQSKYVGLLLQYVPYYSAALACTYPRKLHAKLDSTIDA